MDDIAYVALGSNVGDRAQHLEDAIERIALIPESRIVAKSSVEQTEPLGSLAQAPYLNQMLALQTALAPPALLSYLTAAEIAGGRTRSIRWAPRTIDLDIVKYATTVWDSPELKVPHAEIDNRDFWLRELAELDEIMH